MDGVRAIGVWRAARACAASLRRAWMVVGMVMLVLVGLETLWRVQHGFEDVLSGPGAQDDNDAGVTESDRGVRAEAAASATSLDWRPYVYYRRHPFRGTHVTVDSQGLRRTVVPVGGHRTPMADVFVFGGSPIWGTNLPDAATIPSAISSALVRHGARDVVVTNFGQDGYTISQELVELMLQLQAGRCPSVVVFYDGYDDVAAAIANGYAGASEDEAARTRETGEERELFPWQPDLATDVRVLGAVGELAARRFEILSALRRPRQGRAAMSDSDVVAGVSSTYLSTLGIIEALGRAYGFTPVFAWMPVLDPSEKPMSAAEQHIWRALSPPAHRIEEDFQGTRREVAMTLGRASTGTTVVDAVRFLSQDTATDFAGDLTHTTQRASERIADSLAARIAPILGVRPHGQR